MSENRKEQIIQAALKRFAHYGYHKTSMNEIAEDLRITKANLYYYYADKASLVNDCISYIFDEMGAKESEVVNAYNGNLLESIFQLLDIHATYIEEYYMMSIQDVSEWIKNVGIEGLVDRFDKRNQQNLHVLFRKAVDNGELFLSDVEDAALAFNEIVRGLGTLCRVEDIMTGIPDISNVKRIVESQKRAVRFIFEGKLNSKQS